MEKSAKNKTRKAILNFTGCFLLILAAMFVGVLIISRSPEIIRWYSTYQDTLVELENRVMSINNTNTLMFVSVVMLLYLVKSVIPILPISAMCFLTGAVMSVYAALAVNICGLVMMMTLKFYWGKKLGGGGVHKILKMNGDILTMFKHDGKASPWLLFVFRLVPSFPVNSVSQLYGAMNYKYLDFIIISLGGFMPKLVSYTIVGRNIFDPLSSSFLTPLIVIFSITGISMLTINVIITSQEKGKKSDEKLN